MAKHREPIILPGSDEAFFQEHRDRNFRIRLPTGPNEFRYEFSTLGDHAYDRRLIIACRGMIPFGPRVMQIPFLAFADETIEDDDKTLQPIVDQMMRDAAKGYGIKPSR